MQLLKEGIKEPEIICRMIPAAMNKIYLDTKLNSGIDCYRFFT